MDENRSARPGRPNSYAGHPTFVLAASILVLLGVAVWTLWQARPVVDRAASQVHRGASWPATRWKNARPDVKFVGDSACARCHAEIAASFRSHPMGRSLAPIAVLKADGDDRSRAVNVFEAGSSRFTIDERDGHCVHRETRLDEQGQVLAEVEAEVKYALGSGTRGTSYLVEHDGRLFQSPISWYGQTKKWDLAPGYDATSLHFDRPIEPGCLFCHANRVEPVEHSVNRYEPPVFRGHAIGCERCHGPGELHARRQEMVEGRDLTIVNPRHLEPALRMAVCEQCHLLGDQRVDRPGRGTFDYRPGLPLSEFFAVYGRAEARGNAAVGQVEQMRLSRCFRESRGRLDCVSCHDPHQVPTEEERTAFFRQQCLACHEGAGCKLPASVRLSKSNDDNCVQCHMPRANSVDIVHTATTDHRIPRTPEAPRPRRAQPGSGPPLLLMNGDKLGPNERESLARELAIALAAEGPRLPNSPEVRKTGSFVLSVLERAIKNRPDDLAAGRMKAQALALSGRRAEALRFIQSVLQLAPTDEKALEQCLAYAIDGGDIQAAVEPARRAVALNPWSSLLRERLAYVLIERHEWEEALRQANEALRLDPFRRFARMFMIESLLHQKDGAHAQEQFTTLIRLYPGQRDSLTRWFADQQQK